MKRHHRFLSEERFIWIFSRIIRCLPYAILYPESGHQMTWQTGYNAIQDLKEVIGCIFTAVSNQWKDRTIFRDWFSSPLILRAAFFFFTSGRLTLKLICKDLFICYSLVFIMNAAQKSAGIAFAFTWRKKHSRVPLFTPSSLMKE